MIRQLITAVLAALTLASSLSALAADANQASAAELEAVKGIGPSLSAKITTARQQGPFKSWADLVDRVPGLGAANAVRFSQAGLTVAGAAYVPMPATAKPAREKKPARDSAAAKAAQS